MRCRFGFRFDSGASLIEKAERLQRIAEENLAESELTAEEVETRWQDVVVALYINCNIMSGHENSFCGAAAACRQGAAAATT